MFHDPRGVSSIPTIPNDESFVPRIDHPCLHARSTLKIPDYPVLSIFLPRISLSLSIPLNPVRQSVPGEKRLSYFSRSQTYISFRLNALHDSYHSPLGVDLNLKFRHTFRNGDTKAKRDKGFTKYSCFLFFAKKKKKRYQSS